MYMYLFQVFFAVLIGAFALGQAGPNMEALFTAAGAAGTIFETIDRVSDCTSNFVYTYRLVDLNFIRKSLVIRVIIKWRG